MLTESSLHHYASLIQQQASGSLVLLLLMGFLGGLLSSLLPCVLSLLPVNLAYIGTLKIDNKFHAFQNASLFVLGVSVVLTLLGIFGNFAFAVFTEYKGIIGLVIGIFIILMSLSLLSIFKLPLPSLFNRMPEANPFVVGLAFALVSSPCSSPVLISVLSIASSMNSLLKSILITFGYSLGYTALIFVASLSTGLIKQLNWFKENSDTVVRFSAIILLLIGIFYTIVGVNNL